MAQFIKGICGRCSFRGYVAPKLIPPDNSLSAIGPGPEDPIALQVLHCVTCYHTPVGCKSDNELHQRLAEKEYLEK